MSSDNIEEEERIADEQHAQAIQIIHGTIRDLSGLKRNVVSLEPSASVEDAVNAMIEHRMGSVLIVEDGKLQGLFSERDVLTRIVAQGRVPAETPISEVMTSDLECLSFDDEIVFALNKMTVGGYRHIPILDKDGTATAVISMRDVVEYIVSYCSSEVYNLPSDPADVFTSKREGA